MHLPRILVVEDNPIEQKIVEVLAARCGFAVEIAATAYKALDLLAGDSRYAAVLMNCMLPAMSGLECTQRIRQLNPKVSGVPIIAVTAMTLDNAREQCIQAGMDDYLSKPYTVEQFNSMLWRWIDEPASTRRH